MSVAVLAVLALAAGGVRVLPWVLDPDLPSTIAMPFARSVATLAIEAAILVGWPVGWALATFGMVERGEARVIASLGESPLRTTMRLVPQAIALGLVLAVASALGARDATEPGRVLTELLERGHDVCAQATKPTTLTVPFLGATWLCAGGDKNRNRAENTGDRAIRGIQEPRLAGSPPGYSLFFTATNARVAPDLRRIELDDAWLHFGADATKARVHASSIVIRGLPPFARASSIRPRARALGLSLAAALAALASVWATLWLTERRSDDASPRIPARLRALAIGAAGPLTTLGLLRLLERALDHADSARLVRALAIAALPIASVLATLLTAWTMSSSWLGSLEGLVARARRLLARRPTATK